MCWSIELHCTGLAVVPEGAPVHSWLGRPLPTGGEWKQVGRTEIEFEDNAWAIMKDFIRMIIIHSYISFGSVISRSSSYVVKLYYVLFTDCFCMRHMSHQLPFKQKQINDTLSTDMAGTISHWQEAFHYAVERDFRLHDSQTYYIILYAMGTEPHQ